ncbi:MAG TPA: ROK family protein [Actinomycetales bacterium]|nr:ROK family protein [Actinomycetales bacterium]
MTDAELAQPVATERLRQQNTALVLRSLRGDGSASRATLAARTGLSKATVGTIVQALQDVGAVREDDAVEAVRTGHSGRPGRPVVLDGANIVGLGLEVNVDYLFGTALDLSGRPVLSRQVIVSRDGDLLASLVNLATRCLDELVGQGRRVLGIAVAIPALVDRATRHVVDAPNLGWRDLDLGATLAAAVGQDCPVRVDNDANCAATAELDHGAARGATDALYLTGTVGLGAGLVVDGAVRRGAHGLAGEVGHTPFPGSPTARCICGRRGCWEASVGLRATLRAVGLPADPGTDPVSAGEEVARLARRDASARAAVRRVAADLGAGLVPLVGALDPQVVVLGGYFVPLGPWVVPVVQRALDRGRGPGRATASCRVALSTLGLHAASTGAATDVLGDVYAGTLALG